jgi:hypothetical protein
LSDINISLRNTCNFIYSMSARESTFSQGKAGKLAVLWRGDGHALGEPTVQNHRLNPVFEALTALGIRAELAIYADHMADRVRQQLLNVDGVLVWVDPISGGKTRTQLDAMLRDVASRRVWVSAHPDVILKMGVKEVLYRTKHLGWGTVATSMAAPGRSASSFPTGFNRRGRGSSNKTEAMAVRVCGRWSSFRRLRTRRSSFACSMHAAGVYPKRCRSAIS